MGYLYVESLGQGLDRFSKCWGYEVYVLSCRVLQNVYFYFYRYSYWFFSCYSFQFVIMQFEDLVSGEMLGGYNLFLGLLDSIVLIWDMEIGREIQQLVSLIYYGKILIKFFFDIKYSDGYLDFF